MDPKQPLRPQHFLARANGELTALVAVDELPHNILIDGVPRVYAQGDTAGMTSLGTVPSRGRMYSVQLVSEGANNGSYPQTTKKAGNSASPPNPSKTPVNAGSNETSKNKGKEPERPKKEYCSYWIRHGECDYEQQGCKFKHEMPLDPAILTKLCLRDVPKWYRDKHGIGSMKAIIHASQMVGDRKPGNPAGQKNASSGEASGSRQIQPIRKWRQFAQPDPGSSPSSMRKDFSRGSGVTAAGPSDQLTQDPLPGYPALDPVRPAGFPPQGAVSNALSSGQQRNHPTDPQSNSNGKPKSASPTLPVKVQERSATQGTTWSENAALPMQRHNRRQRSRRFFQPRTGSLESGSSPDPNSNAANQNRTSTGSNQRSNFPPSKVPDTAPQPSTSHHKRSQSTVANVQTAVDEGKQEGGKRRVVNRNGAEKSSEPETVKPIVSSPGETNADGVNLKPGAETDVFGLGIYDN